MGRKLIYLDDAIEAIDETTWYHQNRNKDMVSGANSQEHQAWYKADDVYKALEQIPSAQPDIIQCKDCYWWEKQESSLQGRCDRYGFYPTGYWYCAGARERKDNETD